MINIEATSLNPTSVGLKISNAPDESDITLAEYNIVTRTLTSSYLTTAMISQLQDRIRAVVAAFVTAGDEDELRSLLSAMIWVTDFSGYVFSKGEYAANVISVKLTGIRTDGPMYVIASMAHSLGPLASPLSL